MQDIEITVDQTLCIECGACIDLCVSAAVYQEVDPAQDAGLRGETRAVAPEDCWLCGHCVAACPTDAISHSGFPLNECPEIDPAVLPSLAGLVTAFRERRSARVFLDRPVPREVVRDLVDLSRWVPSASNEQPVDWLAFDKADRIAALSAGTVEVLAGRAQELRRQAVAENPGSPSEAGELSRALQFAQDLERLAEFHARGEDPIFYRAPVVLVAHVPVVDGFGRDDAVYAAYNLMLAAERLGLGTCQIGYFQEALDRSRQLRGMLGLVQDRRAEVTLVLGYPVHGFHRLIPRRQPELLWDGS